MNYSVTNGMRARAQSRLLRFATSLFLAMQLAVCTGAAAEAAGRGGISGTVTSASTGNALQGATVSIPTLNRTVLTDQSGHFLMEDVPAGIADLWIQYTGFTEVREPVNVSAGAIAQRDFSMNPSDVITMEQYTVNTVREGQALAITLQNNAPNIKNVTALDEWGILPTQNVGELVSRLPGITFTTDEDNLIMNVSIGGQPASYTRLNIDGMSTTGVGGDGRTATLHSFSGSMYEQVEIIAGQTPDKRADSLGGQLNLVTASPLAMAERRRFHYTVAGRWFPPWSERNWEVGERPLRPDFNMSYTEVFDVGGGRKNLGISLSASYQEVINPHNWDLLLWPASTNPVVPLVDYTRQSGFNDRFISAFSARADYRVSPTTTVSLRFLYNAGSEPFFHYTAVNPFISGAANLTVYDPVTAPNGGIMPGFTANRTEIRPVGNAQMRLAPQWYSFTSRNPTGTLMFTHNLGRLKLDHSYRWSKTHWESGAGRHREGGSLAMRTAAPIGFVLDYSDPMGRVFTQTAGPSVYDLASYTPYQTAAANTTTQPVAQTSMSLVKRFSTTATNEVSAQINGTYSVPTERPITLKAGLDTINRRVNNKIPYAQRWYAVPGAVMPLATIPLTEFELQHGGQRLPILSPAAMTTLLDDSTLWTRDLNYTATEQYRSRRLMEEGVDSAYIQGSTKFGRLAILAGVRGEWVSTESFSYAPRPTRTQIAVQPDHFKRAAMDYIPVSRDGKYNKYFPGIHLAYNVTENLKLRASWTNSYGRPLLSHIVAIPSINENNQTISIGNPDLVPQTARNIDFRVDYNFGSNGLFTARVFRKDIKDYIGSATRAGELVPDGPNNGFDGQYVGFEFIRPLNLGDSVSKGIELDFRQRLTFLPGILKGLSVRANYTYVETSGKFEGTIGLNPGQVAGYIPRTYNVGLQYAYRKFGASFDVNYTGKYPVTYSVSSGVGNRTRAAWLRMNAGVSYKLRPQLVAFLNVNDLNQENREEYIFTESRHRQLWIIPLSVKFGLTGTF